MRAVPRDVLVDAVIVVALYGVLAVTINGGLPHGTNLRAIWPAHLVGAVMLAPLAVRRRRPLAMMIAVTVGIVAFQLVQPLNLVVPVAALGLAMYSVAVHAPRRQGNLLLAGAGGILLLVLTGVVWTLGVPMATWTPRLGLFAIIFAAAWLVGHQTRHSREHAAELQVKTAELELERQRSALQAATEERLRIARELHDVLGHHVSVMVMQAAGAQRVLASDPDKVRSVLASIESAGREAVAEMQRVLSLLRDYDDRARPPLARLDELVGEIGNAGVHVTLHRHDLPPLPPSIDLAATRVVQEALTNVLRHAGPDSSAAVRVAMDGDLLLLTVDDSGPRRPPRVAAPGGSGRGLLGLRERVELLGGSFTAGPRAEGGFRVTARLPTTPNRPTGSPQQAHGKDPSSPEP